MELSDFKGQYSGRIFVCGNGPSWKHIGSDSQKRLNSEYTFVGSRFFEWKGAGFAPGFYILTERKQSSQWMDSGDWKKAKASIARFWTTWQPAPSGWVPLPRPPSNAHDVLHYGFDGLMGLCQEGTDSLCHLHHGKDTPLAMLQVARYMGFTKFYLVGCDNTQMGKVYDETLARTMHAPGLMDAYWQAAKAKFGAALVDCTPGGRLNEDGILPYKLLEEVLAT